MRRLGLGRSSLPVQMVLSSIVLVLVTASAAGLPAIFLLRDQLDWQAWAQVEQGSQAAVALYDAAQSELDGLATLTAQRPTLNRLLSRGDQEELLAYLGTLRAGTGLDLVLICGPDGRAMAQAGSGTAEGMCGEELPTGPVVLDEGPAQQAWLLAGHPLKGTLGGATSSVVVGVVLDDRFADQMRAQTGLEHILLADGHPVATSLTGRQQTACAAAGAAERETFSLAGHPYYAVCLPFATGRIKAELALDVSESAATQRQLVWALAVSILVVAVLASLLGIFLARQIARPLAHLVDAAEGMSEGDLDTPVTVETRVREVSLVAQALEGARIDLRGSLAELRREKDWTDNLLEAIVEGIVTLDERGHITFFSHGAEWITGWQRSKVVGRSCDQVFKPVETNEPFSQLIPAPGRRVKIMVELDAGRQAILAVTGARLLPPEGREARVALVFRDISEEEAVHRLLGHFLANVAHEFRTPLSALAAVVELLLDQASDLTPGELEELLASLHLGVLGLQTLIDNLLESASMEAGHFRVHPRSSHLDAIVSEAIRTMQPLLDKRGQRLVVELPAEMPVVRADPRRTTQVLVNLLSNANRYGPDDAEIEIRATTRGDWVRVTVTDAGPGVPHEHRGDLFRRFTQPGHGNDRAQVGAGLGLSVVKTVVEAHGGEVGIDDHHAGGSIFWFTLPRSRER